MYNKSNQRPKCGAKNEMKKNEKQIYYSHNKLTVISKSSNQRLH